MADKIIISAQFDNRRRIRKHTTKLALGVRAKKSVTVRLGLWLIRLGAVIAGFSYEEEPTDVNP